MQAPGRPTTLDDFLREAAAVLEAQGWKVTQCQTEDGVAWHLAARKGDKWRLVQVVLPATCPADCQEGRRRLGEAAQLPARLGSMEQWMAHIRPDGRVTFGPYTLNPQIWGNNQHNALERLSLNR
ncbi:MAG TPA: hypothetical protein VHS99_13160 [Chloroflexota bacterium]|jgi:hypothetical protein|nr:hypothetical protein [Chloroflexota bacterium]